MMHEYIDFVESMFPSIDPYKAEEVKKTIKQFEDSGEKYQSFLYTPFNYLAQGDIIGEIPFTRIDKNGMQRENYSKGLLLSNTCDAENDDTLIFAPLLPVEKLKIDKNTIKKNTIYDLIYFPDYKMDDYVVDLSIINTYSTKLINKLLEQDKIKKTASLSDFGYYLFLSKLTIHFMRPEDTKVQNSREI